MTEGKIVSGIKKKLVMQQKQMMLSRCGILGQSNYGSGRATKKKFILV
jgi:hypothetical protein